MIKVTDKYFIDSDKDQWFVKVPAPSKRSKDETKIISYHGYLESAVHSLSQRMLRESDYNSIKDLAINAQNINKLLTFTFKDLIKLPEAGKGTVEATKE